MNPNITWITTHINTYGGDHLWSYIIIPEAKKDEILSDLKQWNCSFNNLVELQTSRHGLKTCHKHFKETYSCLYNDLKKVDKEGLFILFSDE